MPPTDTFTYAAVERIGNTLYGYKNGTLIATQAIAVSLQIPAGSPSLHIGAGVTSAHQTFGSCVVDMLQVRRQSVFGGVSFTPPTTPVPC